ncbi:hypothetical protein [Nesterenkonia sp. NBAIMH1]|uniref:hypothetical protein n=1 Tax=Nesterenkonia sp. NBAIMH1 TaxID=2600320 RepID=UPI0011B423C3|nr:hypothetical protein [Nesterenkonia sp. NBAIMH1]
MKRIIAAARLHLLPKSNVITMTLMVLPIAYIIQLGIVSWLQLQNEQMPGGGNVGGVYGAVIGALVVTAAMAGAYGVPHALSLSYSRRVTLAGLVLVFAASSLTAGALVAAVIGLEQLTDTFGTGQSMLAIPDLMEPAGAWGLGLVIAATTMFLMMNGLLAPMLYRRLGTARMLIVYGLAAVVLLVGGAGITAAGGWGAVFSWVVEQNALTWTGWLTLGALVMTGANWLVIRRIPAA